MEEEKITLQVLYQHTRGNNKTNEKSYKKIIEKRVSAYNVINNNNNNININNINEEESGEIEVIFQEEIINNEIHSNNRKSIVVSGLGGEVIHCSFELNDNITTTKNDTNDYFEESDGTDKKDIVRRNSICWNAFSSRRQKEEEEEEYTTEHRVLSVLSSSSIIRVLDVYPNSAHKHKNKTTLSPGGDAIPLPFEADSIFPISYYNSYTKESYHGLIIQRFPSNDDMHRVAAVQQQQQQYEMEMTATGGDLEVVSTSCRIRQHDSSIMMGDINNNDLKHGLLIDTATTADDDNASYNRHVSRTQAPTSPLTPVFTASAGPSNTTGAAADEVPAAPLIQQDPPSLFSLCDTLDEVRPISLLSSPYNNINNNQLFSDAFEQVLFIGNHPCSSSSSSSSDIQPICVTYHSQLKRHAIWKIHLAPSPPPPKPLWQAYSDPSLGLPPPDIIHNLSLFSEIHPHLAFSLIWDELHHQQQQYPSHATHTADHAEFSHNNDVSPLPNKASNIFIASNATNDQNNGFLLCLLCSNSTLTSTTTLHNENNSILRCLSISYHNININDSTTTDYHVQHLMDKYCISAQPIQCFPPTINTNSHSISPIDIILCSFKDDDYNTTNTPPYTILSLYRANIHITDCAVPIKQVQQEYNTQSVDDDAHVIQMQHPVYNRLDFTYQSSSSSSIHNQEDSITTLRAYLTFNVSNISPITEALLSSIDSTTDVSIPLNIKLQIRVQCIRLLEQQQQQLNLVDDTSFDPAWKALTNVLCSLWETTLFPGRRNSTPITDNTTTTTSSSRSKNKKPLQDVSSWQYLLTTEYHTNYSNEHSFLFVDDSPTTSTAIKEQHQQQPSSNIKTKVGTFSNNISTSMKILSNIFDTLHLFYEECKLHRNTRGESWMNSIGTLLQTLIIKYSISNTMNDFLFHYQRDNSYVVTTPSYNKNHKQEAGSDSSMMKEEDRDDRFTSFDKAPCIFTCLDYILQYGYHNSSRNDTFFVKDASKLYGCNYIQKILKFYSILFPTTTTISNNNDKKKQQEERDRLLVLAMVKENNIIHECDDHFLQDLPLGIVLPIQEALYRCRYSNNPISIDSDDDDNNCWPAEAFYLIGRNDLAEMIESRNTKSCSSRNRKRSVLKRSSILARMRGSSSNTSKTQHLTSQKNNNNNLITDPNYDPDKDGILPLQHFSSMLFPNDYRIKEAGRILRSSRPCYLSVPRAVEVSDHDFERLKQERLLLLCRRSLALPCGRGMCTLNTMIPLLAEPLPIPDICLAGRVPSTNATLALDITSCPSDMTTWPEFHNGVAAGLRLALQSDKDTIARTWIVYNKPCQSATNNNNNNTSTQNRTNPANNNNATNTGTNHGHGGLLMALGLRGHLSSLKTTDVYEYLTQGVVTTTVGIFIGLSASKRGTCDPNVSKTLCMHIPSLLPPSFATMEIASATQSAAITGIGLLYQGSSHRLMTEFLLNEMGRRPSSDHDTQDRESYSLSCGLALGFVNLSYTTNRNNNAAGLSDLNIEERLHRYIIGGYDQTELHRKSREASDYYYRSSHVSSVGAGAAGTSESECCSRISEGDFINIDVTAPGAILALGLMYLKSGNTSVASRLDLPDTHFLLDYVRPDLLMLRVIAQSLILWNDVLPTVEWVQGKIPFIVKKSFERIEMDTAKASGMEIERSNSTAEEEEEEGNSTSFDRQAIKQAHAYIVAGACFALGLRYAGTADPIASSTIAHYVKAFRKLRDDMDPISFALRPERPVIEMCLVSSAIALSMVMAGTGDLDTFRLLRLLRAKVLEDYVRYGSHMALGMAVGLLFLGGGSCTLGTDKEDIAALLMAFFPRFPSHTSDNLYHLQALRHCYVLAVRYREMEAIDVDTREPVYVPLEVTLKDGIQKKWTTPCLVPYHNIKQLSINSELFFPLTMDDRDFSPVVQSNGSSNTNGMNHFGCLPLLVKKKPAASVDKHFAVENKNKQSCSMLILSNGQEQNYDSTSTLLQVAATFQNEDDHVDNFFQQNNIRTNKDAIKIHMLVRSCITAMECNRWSTFHVWDVRLISSYYNIHSWDEASSIMNRNNTRITPLSFLSHEFVLELQERIDRYFASQDMDGKTILACRDTTDPFYSNDKRGLLGFFFIWLDVPNTF